MSVTNPDAPYVVGYGRPPVQTQFQRGRSANPGGVPGPAKHLRKRFNLALREALEKDTQELAAARPANALCAVARQIALDAVFGQVPSQKFMLDLLDGEIRELEGFAGREPPLEAPSAFVPAPSFGLGLSDWKELISLVQGQKQGTKNGRVRAIYEILEQELVAAQCEAGAPTGRALGADNAAIALGTPVAVAQTK